MGTSCTPSKSAELAPREAGAGPSHRSVGHEEPQGWGAPGQRAFWGGEGRDGEMGWQDAGTFQPTANSRQTACTLPRLISVSAAWALFAKESAPTGHAS